MKILFWSVGKAHEAYSKTGIDDFTKRISNYFSVDWELIPPPKEAAALPENAMKKKEGEAILKKIKKDDYLVALDERGRMLTSPQVAAEIQARANAGTRRMVFLIGGAYGLDTAVLQRANLCWSLSKLVFPHQLVRLVLSEQVYRACTILRNEKYHHL